MTSRTEGSVRPEVGPWAIGGTLPFIDPVGKSSDDVQLPEGAVFGTITVAAFKSRASSAHMIGMPSRIGYASLSGLQINSCAFLSYASGPLQIGQTKISSSRVST